jgi:hypothetical protein
MTTTDPTGALAGEFHPTHTPKDALPQRTPGTSLPATDETAEAVATRGARHIELDGGTR